MSEPRWPNDVANLGSGATGAQPAGGETASDRAAAVATDAPQSVEPEDVMSVYVILNGSLGMSAGKIAAQAFHCGWASAFLYMAQEGPGVWTRWIEQGRRVSIRIAETDHVFHRVQEECRGHLQIDEGFAEVDRGSETAFVTIPYRRGAVPGILSHKRVQLFRDLEPGSEAEDEFPVDART